MSQNNFPSEDDFLKAKMARANDSYGLSMVRDKILTMFRSKGVHEFMIIYSRKVSGFGAYVFYEVDRQIRESAENGLKKEIEDAVCEELKEIGRSDGGNVKVKFEFDSHEKVMRDYGGNYFDRLR